MISTHHIKMLLHVLLPVLSGTMIYAFWRGIPLIDSSREIFPLFSLKYAPDWLIYNLPDGLWCYALLSTLFLIWKGRSVHYSLWLLVAIAFTFLSEIIQAYHLIQGTFDWNDLIAYTVAIATFYLNFQSTGKLFSLISKIIES